MLREYDHDIFHDEVFTALPALSRGKLSISVSAASPYRTFSSLNLVTHRIDVIKKTRAVEPRKFRFTRRVRGAE